MNMQNVIHNVISAFGKLKLSHPITMTTITADKYNPVTGKVCVEACKAMNKLMQTS